MRNIVLRLTSQEIKVFYPRLFYMLSLSWGYQLAVVRTRFATRNIIPRTIRQNYFKMYSTHIHGHFKCNGLFSILVYKMFLVLNAPLAYGLYDACGQEFIDFLLLTEKMENADLVMAANFKSKNHL
jgi:hypothetical protein